MQPVTVYLTVSVLSLYTTSHLGERDLVGAGEAMRPSTAQVSMESRSTVAAGFETLSYQKDHLPGENTTSMSPTADGSAGMSLAKNALRNADEAMTTINLSNAWEGAFERIKWVMDTVSPVTEVRAVSFFFYQSLTEPGFQLHPCAKIAYGLLFAIPKVIYLRYCWMEILIWSLDPARTIST